MLNETDLSRVDLNLLVVFEVVLEERHVGRAAARLSLSASAVSHSLGRLRDLLKDPLFLRTPKGVVPSARALELAAPVADILSRVQQVVASAIPFAPETSTRRFTIGAPDAVAAVMLPILLAELGRTAPGINLSMRHTLPPYALADLEARTLDLAIAPIDDIPARFLAKTIHQDQFVVAAHKGHPFLRRPTLASYCEQRHVLVSATGDAHGFIDQALARKGLARRIALVVPHFMLAIAALPNSQLITALPSTFVAIHGARFGVSSVDSPLPLHNFQMRAIVPHAAMRDAGMVWLLDLVERASHAAGALRERIRTARTAKAKVPRKVARRR